MTDIMEILIAEYHDLYEFIKKHQVDNLDYTAKSIRLRELYIIVEKELIRRYIAKQMQESNEAVEHPEDAEDAENAEDAEDAEDAENVEDAENHTSYCGFDCCNTCSICAGSGFNLADEI
jgi:hypothetical protein